MSRAILGAGCVVAMMGLLFPLVSNAQEAETSQETPAEDAAAGTHQTPAENYTPPAENAYEASMENLSPEDPAGEGLDNSAGSTFSDSPRQEGAYVPSASPPDRPLTESEIVSRLNQPIKSPLQYEAHPLRDVLQTLDAEYDLPIIIDYATLEDEAVSPDTEVTINLRNVTLRSALKLIMQQPGLSDLTFVIDQGVLLITTNEVASEKLTVQVYKVDDLIKGLDKSREGYDKPYGSLVQTIICCVQHDSWSENGKGEGQIQLMQPGILVVTQTSEVQQQVQELLDKIRAMRNEMGSADTGGGSF